MLRNCVLLTCVLAIGFTGASEAAQSASPRVVYIDGLPCNRLCLSYMAWSRSLHPDASVSPAQSPPVALVQPETVIPKDRSKPAAQTRVAKASQIPPHSNQVPRAKVTRLLPAGKAASTQAREAKPAASKSNQGPPAKVASLPSAGDAAAAEPAAVQPVAPKPNDMPPAKVADLPPAASADAVSDKPATSIADPHPNAKTAQEQVMAATALASQLTAATAVPASDQKTSKADGSGHPATGMPADAHEVMAALPNGADRLVALVMVGPDIKSVSDLTGKTIAIDDAQSASSQNVRAAIVAAGAAEVQLTDGPTKAIDQLMSGAVPAAVLALVSPEAAQGFPEIAGFKIFQVPLSPRSLKTGADTP
jgi:hypothetical protein